MSVLLRSSIIISAISTTVRSFVFILVDQQGSLSLIEGAKSCKGQYYLTGADLNLLATSSK